MHIFFANYQIKIKRINLFFSFVTVNYVYRPYSILSQREKEMRSHIMPRGFALRLRIRQKDPNFRRNYVINVHITCND